MEDNIELIVTSIKELTKKRRLVYINYEPAFALYAAELRKFGICLLYTSPSPRD